MKRVHVIGRKNHGKTTLVCELVEELRSRGLRIGTIKHTHHDHELDTPGKDSHRHRDAGAAAVGILTRSSNAVFWPAECDSSHGEGAARSDDRYVAFARAFPRCDLVLVEGDTQTSALKVEVWRSVHGTAPISDTLPGVRALVTDDPVDRPITILARSDVASIADMILRELDDRAGI